LNKIRSSGKRNNHNWLRRKSYTIVFKICCSYCPWNRITAAIGYPVYQNQIESQTVLVETAVQKKVNAKIQEATFIKSPIPAVTLAVKENKMPYHMWLALLEKKQMQIKFIIVYQH
jgi:hypothetical protein